MFGTAVRENFAFSWRSEGKGNKRKPADVRFLAFRMRGMRGAWYACSYQKRGEGCALRGPVGVF